MMVLSVVCGYPGSQSGTPKFYAGAGPTCESGRRDSTGALDSDCEKSPHDHDLADCLGETVKRVEGGSRSEA
eukprot:CAMPEP_0184689536 /NCGR_PEP_ID=MMETSP0312-20130426/30712_1 /TAXON_ID=31354 /ORGANISM="Compsopogon coeruleus, Strain SAG 36.94" /LENGTH=71 /DNA_ID=CAMNT_0027146897 /DNA_START=184 /DNA_END=399 /DNA_ORIENTATION=+